MASFQVYLSKEDLETYEKFKKIARREEKPASELVKDLMRKYVKRHGEGNPNFEIGNWITDSQFKAFPTMGEVLYPDKLNKLDDDNLLELAKAARGRSQEINAALKRRHIPKYDFDMGFGLS